MSKPHLKQEGNDFLVYESRNCAKQNNSCIRVHYCNSPGKALRYYNYLLRDFLFELEKKRGN